VSVFAWIETFDGSANPTSWEALGAGRNLADVLGVPLTALVFGENAATIAAEAGKYGADKALVCEDATLSPYRLEPYAALLTHLVTGHQPKVVVAVATSAGRELLAASAADTDSGMLSEVIELNSTNGTVQAVKPVYAGKVLSKVSASSTTVFVTLRGRAFPRPDQGSGSADVTTVEPVLTEDAISTKVEDFAAEVGKVNLTDAAIIVSGGRGIANNPKSAPADADDEAIWKAQDGFANTLQPLVDTLGAAMGASRAAVDAGYIPYEHQVGQTGKTVNPDLYIAAGISGAIQHQAGMRGSKIIVAVNKDKDAPIFKLARYGVVEDLYTFIPVLTAELKKRLGK